MSVFSDLLSAWPGLLLIAAAVGVLVWYGRGEPTGSGTPVRFRPGLYVAGSWQPPTPPVIEREPVPVPWTPPYAELTVAAVTRRYGDNPADIAARWLRDIDAEQGATVRVWRSPATDRDLTGAFPVVRAA